MRKLSFFGILLAILWTGYWYGSSDFLQKRLTDFIATDFGLDDPVQISHSGLKLQGFPARFDIRLSDPGLTAGKHAILWNSPSLQIYAPSYKPHQISVALARKQMLHLKGQDFQIDSNALKAGLGFVISSFFKGAMVVDNANVIFENLAVSSNSGWTTTLGPSNLMLQKADASSYKYSLNLVAKTISLPQHLRMTIDPAARQPEIFESLVIDSWLDFNAPLDLMAARKNQPEVTEIRLNSLRLIWGDLQFGAEGNLRIDHNGYPDGTLNLTAHGWQGIFQLADNAGLVDPEFALTIQNILTVMAKMSKGQDTVQAPLNFANGQMSLGLFPVGAAPRLK